MGAQQAQSSNTSTGTAPPHNPSAVRGKLGAAAARRSDEAAKISAQIADTEAETAAVRVRCEELQATWTDMSAASNDLLQTADENRRRATLLRKAIDKKREYRIEIEDRRKALLSEKEEVEQEFRKLESEFQERLQRAIGEKEQQLLEEKASLRASSDIAERRIHELIGEKAFIEQRILARGAAKGAGERRAGRHEAMLEAHMTIAHAFGNISSEHPCLRLIDEPTLKLTVLFFKQPLVRRIFFSFSILMWLFAIRFIFFSSSNLPGAPVRT